MQVTITEVNRDKAFRILETGKPRGLFLLAPTNDDEYWIGIDTLNGFSAIEYFNDRGVCEDWLNRGFKIEGDDPVSKHREILDEIHDTYKSKNADYGNSFADTINEFGLVVAAARINDKNNRFKALVRGQSQKVKDENIRDTLVDLAGYAVITLMNMEAK